MRTVTVTSASGARAALIHDASYPLVALNLRVAAGSADDPAGRSGMAHLLEHLMFSRTARHGRGGHFRLIESLGGYVNAKTSADWTMYTHGITPDLLGLVLALETERFTETVPMLAPADLATERQTVLNERSQRMDGPYGRAIEHLAAALFPAGDGYHRLPIGQPDDLKELSLDECAVFHRDHYTGSRVNLSIVGDFDPERSSEPVQNLLSAFSARRLTTVAMTAGTPVIATSRQIIGHSGKSKIFLGYRLPPEGTWEFELARFASLFLGRGVCAWLASALTRHSRMASSLTVKTMGRSRGPSMGVIEIGAAAEPSRVIGALDEALDAACDGAVGKRDLDRAVAIYRSGRLADDDSFMRRSEGYSLAMQVDGEAGQHMRHDDAIFAATVDELRHGIAFWRQPGQRAEVIYQ
jgi:zinc protease